MSIKVIKFDSANGSRLVRVGKVYRILRFL